MTETPRYQLVVVAYKSRAALAPFLEHLGDEVPVIVVDNSAGEEDLSDLLAAHPNVTHLDASGNLGYSAASNLGAGAATADYLVFMNPDTRPSPAALDSLVDYLAATAGVASCGAAGIGTAGGGAQPTAARILAHSLGWHRRFPLSGIYYQRLDGRRVDVGWVAGSCLAISRETFAELGGFDPRYFVYHSDFDLGWRIERRGLRQVVLGDVVIPHFDGGSSDLPARWTWEKRGRAWTRFLRNTRSLPVAIGSSAILLAGYGIRLLIYALLGRRNRVREVWTYLRSGVAEWLAPERGAG